MASALETLMNESLSVRVLAERYAALNLTDNHAASLG